MSKQWKFGVTDAWRPYGGKSDAYHEDGGGNDEYTVSYCSTCQERTEHDVCTGECVEC